MTDAPTSTVNEDGSVQFTVITTSTTTFAMKDGQIVGSISTDFDIASKDIGMTSELAVAAAIAAAKAFLDKQNVDLGCPYDCDVCRED